ncbi:riboflavine-aldehyde-forming enzyme, partial [Pleurotus eryngii]
MWAAIIAMIPLALSATANAFAGDATFFAPGLGACGAVSHSTDLIVALSPAQFAGGANCFHGGKFIEATVVDLCPGCAGDSIDLSPSAFQTLENPDVGRIQVNWNF